MMFEPVPLSGVYTIRNRTTGKTYVGASGNIDRRIRHHFSALNSGTHINPGLQHDFNQLGRSGFSIGIVALINHQDARMESMLKVAVESDWIRTLKGIGVDVYNAKEIRYDNPRRRMIAQSFWESRRAEAA
jgi:group I intron endonuclease